MNNPIMQSILSPHAFFDLTDYPHAAIFADITYVWQALPRLQSYLTGLVGGKVRQIFGQVAAGAFLAGDDIFIGPGAVVEPGAFIAGPAYIGPDAHVRQGAYIRGNALIGAGAIVGHATEVKNSILLPGAFAPHFNYVGDSILGRKVNLGAGAKLSNLTIVSVKDQATGRRPTIKIEIEGERIDTGLSKLGAIMGDGSQVGCNSVLNPGALLGPNVLVYANASLPKGYYPANTIIKLRQTIVSAPRR